MCLMVVITLKSVKREIKIIAQSENLRESWGRKVHQIRNNQKLYKGLFL